jgi:NADH:ubiquinone oxidoreductase subunit 6 (subunit J)
MSLNDFLFWSVGLITGLSAIMVAVTQNIVRAAVWLLFTLGGVAGLFFLLGADFVGATQLIIYVGGILVLVIFGVMLTSQGPFISMKTGAGEWAITLIVGLLLYGLIATSILLADWKSKALPTEDPATARSSTDLGSVMLNFTQAQPEANLSVKPDQPRKYVGYLLPFEIVSVHLLVVLLGAAYLARAKRRRRMQSP